MKTYEKSRHTKFIEAIDELRHFAFDQYRCTAYIMDAVFDTNDLEQLTHKTLRGALGSMQRVFNANSLMDYVLQKDLLEIPAALAGPGDIVIVKDDPHDDIAFCLGRKWLFINDNNIDIDVFDLDDFDFQDAEMRAFRLT